MHEIFTLCTLSSEPILPALILFLSSAQPVPPLCLLCLPSAVCLLGLVSSFLSALVLEIPRPCSLPGSVHLVLPRLYHVEWIFYSLAPGALELGSPFAGSWIPCEISVREGPPDGQTGGFG